MAYYKVHCFSVHCFKRTAQAEPFGRLLYSVYCRDLPYDHANKAVTQNHNLGNI